jgi:hypothetical protein
MDKLLKDTRTLQSGMMVLSEAAISRLLEEELASVRPRKLVVERLHQRFCILRAQRERDDLFRRIK